jgi:hypothetical protein
VKFVLVNGRTPRSQSSCALCCEPIGGGYLRDFATGLCYCDQRCYAEPAWVLHDREIAAMLVAAPRPEQLSFR